MADTGGEITEIKDKIKQLTDLAAQQHGKVDKLTKQFFNLSVSVFFLFVCLFVFFFVQVSST